MVADGREVLDRLVQQVSNPVRWDLCMQTFADLGVTGLIEIPPAGTLTGLAKRALPGVEVARPQDPGRPRAGPPHDPRARSARARDATAAPGDSGTLVTSPSKEA